MIDGAELTLYNKNGENISIDLSPTQLKGIIKLLGIQYNSQTSTYTAFSDEGLQKFMDKTINSWKIKEC